jgi:hypothetical protein
MTSHKQILQSRREICMSDIVVINKEKFIMDILIGAFNGNQTKCATGLGISLRCLTSFLDGKKRSNRTYRTLRFEGALNEYCKKNKIDPQHFFVTDNSI